MSVTIPRPASTIVVLRDAPESPFEILLVRRNDKVAFMAGAYVFPGGRVDDEDLVRAQTLRVEPSGASRFADLTSDQERGYRVAAVRELEEEAAVRLTIDDLVPMAHWVTPESETRRYDTRFYVARMPDGQEARHDEGEMTELAWLPAEEAIERCRQGAMMLPPPTWTTLKRLGRFASIGDVFDWARSTSIIRVEPHLTRGDRTAMLTLPGDPLYPASPGWEVPEDTRFVREEGKGWKPARA